MILETYKSQLSTQGKKIGDYDLREMPARTQSPEFSGSEGPRAAKFELRGGVELVQAP